MKLTLKSILSLHKLLLQDLPGVVQKVAKFLGKALSEEEVKQLTDHCSFSSMSKNKAVNNEQIMAIETERAKGIKFMRKGEVIGRGGMIE